MTHLPRRSLAGLIALFVMGLASTAEAHVGPTPGVGFAAGLTHPFGGLDHLLAMIAVGFWAAQQEGRARWAIPASFLLAMILGGGLGLVGLALPGVEAGVATSVLLLGLAIAAGLRLKLGLAVGLVALFAIFHGHAHGTEMPQAAAPILYGLGFLAATAALHLAGFGLAQIARGAALRWSGAAVALVGVALILI